MGQSECLGPWRRRAMQIAEYSDDEEWITRVIVNIDRGGGDWPR